MSFLPPMMYSPSMIGAQPNSLRHALKQACEWTPGPRTARAAACFSMKPNFSCSVPMRHCRLRLGRRPQAAQRARACPAIRGAASSMSRVGVVMRCVPEPATRQPDRYARIGDASEGPSNVRLVKENYRETSRKLSRPPVAPDGLPQRKRRDGSCLGAQDARPKPNRPAQTAVHAASFALGGRESALPAR
jgi:hypothetical protein